MLKARYTISYFLFVGGVAIGRCCWEKKWRLAVSTIKVSTAQHAACRSREEMRRKTRRRGKSDFLFFRYVNSMPYEVALTLCFRKYLYLLYLESALQLRPLPVCYQNRYCAYFVKMTEAPFERDTWIPVGLAWSVHSLLRKQEMQILWRPENYSPSITVWFARSAISQNSCDYIAIL